MLKYTLAGCVFWGIFLFFLWCLRPGSPLQAEGPEPSGRTRALVLLVLCATVLVCILPMGLSPMWNGEIPEHRDQYERMAEALLEGHLYIDYGDMDPLLLRMANPYDPVLREALGVNFHWDHAFYNGHYYMYFGIVPVLLLFLPFRALTGMSLTTYHATQLFTALYICGAFAVFSLLARRFFKKMSLGLYLALSVAFSLMSTWYCSSAPAMYCTAISAGICMEIWSLYLFMQAVWGGQSDKKSILLAFFGSLLGALAFGCRPPIALGNILVLPLLAEYLRGRRFSWKLAGQLVFAACPYVAVGLGLMAYNYARFDSPFEFGQTYQLTQADLSSYGNLLSQLTPAKLYEFIRYFISPGRFETAFPFQFHHGVFLNFPILLCAGLFLFRKKTLRTLREDRLLGLVTGLIFTILVIAMLDAMASDAIMERYRSDAYWLLGLLAFLLTGACGDGLDQPDRRKFSAGMSFFAVFTVFSCYMLWCVPNDSSYTDCFPEKLEMLQHVFFLGLR